MPRATEHNARTRSNGEVFSAKHNDRKFDIKNAPHVDESLTKNNEYVFCDPGAESQDENEARFYEKHFSDHLEAQNNRYIEQRHPEKVKTIDQYRGSKQTCPEETIYQLGTAEEKEVSADELQQIVKEHLSWIEKTFPQVKILGYALHLDEPGAAPHIHVRRVWIAHDKDGNETVSQSKALEEMGVRAPKEDVEITRYNNPKVTFTLACREHYEKLCKERGIEIPEERKTASEVGLEFGDYKLKKIKAKQKELTKQNAELTEQNKDLKDRIEKLDAENAEKEKQLQHALEIINNNKIAVSPETRKNVRSVVSSIEDLTRRESDIKVRERVLSEKEKEIEKTESKLKTHMKTLDPDNIAARIASMLQPLIEMVFGGIYKELRRFLQIRGLGKVLDEFDRYITQRAMKNTNIDVQKEIKETVKEAEDTIKDHRSKYLDIDER